MILNSFRKQYNEFVLEVPKLEIKPSTIYVVIGANGSGKSTFAKCISGLESFETAAVLKNSSIGYMPQTSYAFRMSVLKNILLCGCTEEKARKAAQKLDIADILDKNAKKLSGGQTARMALARFICADFDLYIFDEPTASMDMKSSMLAEDCIKGCAEKGCSVILITHSISQARRLADEIIYFEDGKLIENGPSGRVLDNPSDPRTKAFLDYYGV